MIGEHSSSQFGDGEFVCQDVVEERGSGGVGEVAVELTEVETLSGYDFAVERDVMVRVEFEAEAQTPTNAPLMYEAKC